MSKIWDRQTERLVEDVTTDRVRPTLEPLDGTKRLANAKSIDLDLIEADPQHREEFDDDALKRLAASLKSSGQLQPIRVRFDSDRSKYVIIAGERRWRAARIAGLTSIDCIIAKGDITNSDILRQQVIENALREDLKPTEQGRAFRDLMNKENWNGKELAQQLNVHPSTVSRMMNLLELPAEIQAKVDDGKLPITQALKHKEGSVPSPKKSATKPDKTRPTRERKIATSLGITVSLKARKMLKDEQVVLALKEALTSLSGDEAGDLSRAA